jgi:phospholipid/cholesterol/gamma-HCH transport system substrate-binding protein
MRRLIAICVLGIALPVLAFAGLGASGGGGSGYEVRAIFDSVASAVPGEDVKVAGAKVGKIGAMDVTAGRKAAVTLKINDARFAPFKSDAHCTIRPQSLIGEKFVECTPGTDHGQPLRKIDRGEGKGQHLLPLARTSSPVDLDLINNTLRMPYRERLAVLLDELGAGLAGRGGDLNAVIHRANPALRDTDKVLAILAGQNRVLAKLASDSDTSLAPLAKQRRRVSDWIVQANRTGQATAERSDAIRASLRKLPGTLRQLRPLMADLEGFADQATPVFTDLGKAAPGVNRLVTQLGPFSSAATPAIKSLGEATRRGRPALVKARPLVQDLRRFGRDFRPVSQNLDDLTRSLDKTGGLERILDYLFFQNTAVNGFDSIGHYLRAELIVNLCTAYATTPAAGCNSRFADSAAAATRTEPALAKFQKARKGQKQSSVPGTGTLLKGLVGDPEDPAAVRQRKLNIERVRRQAAKASPGLSSQDDAMLQYLLGDGR